MSTTMKYKLDTFYLFNDGHDLSWVAYVHDVYDGTCYWNDVWSNNGELETDYSRDGYADTKVVELGPIISYQTQLKALAPELFL